MAVRIHPQGMPYSAVAHPVPFEFSFENWPLTTLSPLSQQSFLSPNLLCLPAEPEIVVSQFSFLGPHPWTLWKHKFPAGCLFSLCLFPGWSYLFLKFQLSCYAASSTICVSISALFSQFQARISSSTLNILIQQTTMYMLCAEPQAPLSRKQEPEALSRRIFSAAFHKPLPLLPSVLAWFTTRLLYMLFLLFSLHTDLSLKPVTSPSELFPPFFLSATVTVHTLPGPHLAWATATASPLVPSPDSCLSSTSKGECDHATPTPQPREQGTCAVSSIQWRLQGPIRVFLMQVGLSPGMGRFESFDTCDPYSIKLWPTFRHSLNLALNARPLGLRLSPQVHLPHCFISSLGYPGLHLHQVNSCPLGSPA